MSEEQWEQETMRKDTDRMLLRLADNPAKAHVKGTIEHPAEPARPEIKSVRHVPGTIHGHNYGPPPNIAVGWLPGVNVPAEPVIEVAPGEYERCAESAQVDHVSGTIEVSNYGPFPSGPWRTVSISADAVPAQEAPVCSVCRKPIEKVDPHAKWTHVEGMDAIRCQSGELYPQPAVPAQEAPQEAICKCGHMLIAHLTTGPCDFIGWLPAMHAHAKCPCQQFQLAEPQAGAQVPSQETITQKMRGRPVTHDEAEVSAQRLINSHFHNDDRARVSIPARPDNDDILVMDYIGEQRANEAKLAHITAYALEAAKTAITRESILAAPQVDETPSDCTAEAFYNKRGSGAVVCSCGFAVTYTRLGSDPEKAGMEFFERMHSHRRHLEAELEACKLHELTQYDEMQGLCRLILSESGGGK